MRDPLTDLFTLPDDAPAPVAPDLPGVARRAGRLQARRRRAVLVGSAAGVAALVAGALVLTGGVTDLSTRLRGDGPAATTTPSATGRVPGDLLQAEDLGAGWTLGQVDLFAPVTVSSPRCLSRPTASVDTTGRLVTYRQADAWVELRVAQLSSDQATALGAGFAVDLDCPVSAGAETLVATAQARLTLVTSLGSADATGTVLADRTAVTLSTHGLLTSGVPSPLPQLADPGWLRSVLEVAVQRATGIRPTLAVPSASSATSSGASPGASLGASLGASPRTSSDAPDAPTQAAASPGSGTTPTTAKGGGTAPKGFLQPADLSGTGTWQVTSDPAQTLTSTGGIVALPNCTDGAQLQLTPSTPRTTVYRQSSGSGTTRLEELVSTLDDANLRAARDQFAVMARTLAGCAPYELTFGPYPAEQTMVTLLAEPDLAVLASVDNRQRLFQVTAYALRGSTFVTLYSPAQAQPFPGDAAWAIRIARTALQRATASP